MTQQYHVRHRMAQLRSGPVIMLPGQVNEPVSIALLKGRVCLGHVRCQEDSRVRPGFQKLVNTAHKPAVVALFSPLLNQGMLILGPIVAGIVGLVIQAGAALHPHMRPDTF